MENNAYVSQANYALSLLRNVRKPGECVLLSPFAITAAFGVVYLGAAGTTKKQLLEFFAEGCSEEELEKLLSHEIAAIEGGSNGYTLNIATRLYLKKDYVLKGNFLSAVKSKFNGQLETTDFSNSINTAEKINKWVESKTNSKIQNLVTPDMFNAMTQLVIVNAVYFKGNWAFRFSTELTKEHKFSVSEGKEIQVQMMHKIDNFDYYADNDVQVVGIPYSGGDVEMFIVLPKERFGLQALLKATDGDRLLRFFHHIRRSKVDVYVPKFKLEKQLNLVETMSRLGLQDIFSNKANFTNISDEPMHISDAVHKAFIEVNEQGTEAAAAVGITMARTINPSGNLPPPIFLADHPFMFAIVKNDNILFIGEYY